MEASDLGDHISRRFNQDIEELRNSGEYLLGRTGFYDNLHRGRMRWVATLDRFDRILDIGGSSPNSGWNSP